MNRLALFLFFITLTRATPAQPLAAVGQRAAYPAQPVYTDSNYRQDYSVKYDKLRVPDTATIRLLKIVSDRNGVVQILTSQGLLRPNDGAFLYPGELTPDKTYRPLSDMHIGGITIYQQQFIYATDKAILSNAWAGKLYLPHDLPHITLVAGGPGFSFLDRKSVV